MLLTNNAVPLETPLEHWESLQMKHVVPVVEEHQVHLSHGLGRMAVPPMDAESAREIVIPTMTVLEISDASTELCLFH